MERETDVQAAEVLLKFSAKSATLWTYWHDRLWIEGTASDVFRRVIFAQQSGLTNERIEEVIKEGEQEAGERIQRSSQATSLSTASTEEMSEAEIAANVDFIAATLLELLVDQLIGVVPDYSGEQIQEVISRHASHTSDYVKSLKANRWNSEK